MALAFLGMLLYQAWQADYGPARQGTAQPKLVQPTTVSGEMPDAPVRADIDDAMPALPGETAVETTASSSRLIKVQTDTLDLVIDTRGGSIVDARLVNYPVAVDDRGVREVVAGVAVADELQRTVVVSGGDQHRGRHRREHAHQADALGAQLLDALLVLVLHDHRRDQCDDDQ